MDHNATNGTDESDQNVQLLNPTKSGELRKTEESRGSVLVGAEELEKEFYGNDQKLLSNDKENADGE